MDLYSFLQNQTGAELIPCCSQGTLGGLARGGRLGVQDSVDLVDRFLEGGREAARACGEGASRG